MAWGIVSGILFAGVIPLILLASVAGIGALLAKHTGHTCWPESAHRPSCQPGHNEAWHSAAGRSPGGTASKDAGDKNTAAKPARA